MNQLAPSRRPSPLGNSRRDAPEVSPSESSSSAQARQFDAIFKSLARQVLTDDDPVAEMPLRQLRVCYALYERPRSMVELSRELGVSQSAITQIADRLELAKMAMRGPVGEDRRVRTLQLTDRARKMLRQREEQRVQRLAAILARMADDDREVLLSALAALQDACSDGEH